MKRKRVPLRMCVGCREMKSKFDLVRVVRDKSGEIKVDSTGKINGRGAYLCPTEACIAFARKRKGLERALETKIDAQFYDMLEQQVKEAR